MKDGYVVLKWTGIKDNVKRNLLIIIFTSVLLFGMICGSLSAAFSPDNSFYGIAEVFSKYVAARQGQSYLTHLLWGLSSSFVPVIFLFLLGLGIQGMFLAPVFPLIQGFGIGILSGYLYIVHSLSGIGFFALILLPNFLPSVFITLVCCKNTFMMSKNYFGLFFSSPDGYLREQFKVYCVRFLICTVIALIICCFSSAISYAFMGIFEF